MAEKAEESHSANLPIEIWTPDDLADASLDDRLLIEASLTVPGHSSVLNGRV